MEETLEMQQTKAEMKTSALECLRDINNQQKKISDEILSTNSRVIGFVLSKIERIQNTQIENLLQHQRRYVIQQMLQSEIARRRIIGLADSLDIDDPSTEPAEIRLDRIKLLNNAESTRRVGNILNAVLGDLGAEHNRYKGYMSSLLNRNAQLTQQHIDHVNTGLEINKLIEENRGSLLDTYADVSTQMPSYMDPDD